MNGNAFFALIILLQFCMLGEKDIKPNSKKSSKMIRNNISYLFQNFALVDNETVFQNLMYALKYVDISEKEKKSVITVI